MKMSILDSSANPQSPLTILASRGRLHYDPDARRLSLELEDGTMHEADPPPRTASTESWPSTPALDHRWGDPWGDRTSGGGAGPGDVDRGYGDADLEARAGETEQQAQIDTALVRTEFRTSPL
ncbi:MAG: hypothetical protein R3E12_08430 [Candidatus Eisenbacteria bacterium]